MIPLPSRTSVHEAPESVYTEPERILTTGLPRRTTIGPAVSMLATVAVVDPVFPAASTKSKVNDPFVVKV